MHWKTLLLITSISSISLFIAKCANRNVEITKEYIINPNWDKDANALQINGLVLKSDSSIYFIDNLPQAELTSKLVDDTSFFFFANAKYNGEDYSTRKVFFNKDNGFRWIAGKSGRKATATTIGSLQKNNWYKFSHLGSYPYSIYVYIDSLDKIHRFTINQANY